MSHHTPQPSGPPPDPADGHERTDIAAKPILYFLVGLVVFGGVVQASMSLLMTGFVAQDTRAPEPPQNIMRDTGSTDVAAPLQQNTTADMVRMYEDEDRVLNTYHVDPQTKEIRIPLDRAVAVIAKKGLPHRDKAPKGTPEADKIPRRGKAYQTTGN